MEDKFRGSITPLKNARLDNNYNFTTPSTLASRHKVKEEECSEEFVNHPSALLSHSRNQSKEEKGGRNGKYFFSTTAIIIIIKNNNNK